MKLERGFSENSVEAYIADVRKLSQYLLDSNTAISPQNVHFELLVEFLNQLNSIDLESRTQARIRSGIKAFFKYMLLAGHIEKDPSKQLEAPKISQKLPDVLSVMEIQAIMDGIDLSHPQGTRNRAILETLYACGIRVSELTNLKLTNLFLDLGFIKVIGKRNKERIVPIGEVAIKHIQLYLDFVRPNHENVHRDHENCLFLNRNGKQLTRHMIFHIVKNAAMKAGISKKVSPHTFRHSFATHLIEGGASLRAIQEMLGHESIITTEVYTHLDTDYLRETINTFHPRNKNADI